MIVARTIDVNLHSGAQLAGMFVKRRFKPTLAQPEHPCSHSGARDAIFAIRSRGSISGAPKSSSGRVVPRPSESVVPSSITVPA